MYIIKIISQHRRDFTAKYKCEGCGATQTDDSGYDDVYYHNNVIPNMKCKKCKESTITLGKVINPKTPKYSEDTII